MTSRPKFDVDIQVNQLLNIPLVSGSCWVRWYVRDSPKPDARGRTPHQTVREHRASWDHEIKLQTRIGIGRMNVLKEFMVIFDVMWDQNGSEKILLGKVEVNLSEYVGSPEPKRTKYLLKNSKINGALSITIGIKQTAGSKNFTVPPMTSSAVFGDITGVMKETKDSNGDNAADILDELHHKQFAVSWTKHDYELDPKSCIEDIFQGGTGFKKVNGVQQTPAAASATVSSASTVSTEPSLRMAYSTSFEPGDVLSNARLLNEEDEREDLRSWKLRTVY